MQSRALKAEKRRKERLKRRRFIAGNIEMYIAGLWAAEKFDGDAKRIAIYSRTRRYFRVSGISAFS